MNGSNSQNIGVRKKRWMVCFESAILEMDLSVYEKMVYIVLCSHAKKDGSAFPSVKTIAREASCSERKVLEILNTVEKMNIISSGHRFSAESTILNSFQGSPDSGNFSPIIESQDGGRR
jgi:hypothetical protein